MSLQQLIENQTEWMIRMGCPGWLREQALQSQLANVYKLASLYNISPDEAAQRIIETRRSLGGHDYLPTQEQ